jgi:hypothetical protein
LRNDFQNISNASLSSIVAIHGDGGHYKESWTHPNSHVFWLQDLLPSIVPDSRILSFGYSVSKTDFVPAEKICEALLGELSEMRQDLTTVRIQLQCLSLSLCVLSIDHVLD